MVYPISLHRTCVPMADLAAGASAAGAPTSDAAAAPPAAAAKTAGGFGCIMWGGAVGENVKSARVYISLNVVSYG